MKPEPRYFEMVRAFAGDSTMISALAIRGIDKLKIETVVKSVDQIALIPGGLEAPE
jgi:hypothetical protein